MIDYIPPHEPRDQRLLASLVADMAARGWVGRPLVAMGGQLLTGSHRYAAARRAGVEPPVVPLLRDDVEIPEEAMSELCNLIAAGDFASLADDIASLGLADYCSPRALDLLLEED